MNRIRRISTDLMESYKGKFTTDFSENKKILDEVAIIRAKGLKNEIAGYITSHLRRELEEKKGKESKVIADNPTLERAEEIQEQMVS